MPYQSPFEKGDCGGFSTVEKESPWPPFFKGGILDPQSTTFNQTPQNIAPNKAGGLPTGTLIQFFIVESQNFDSPDHKTGSQHQFFVTDF
jgi:hypothetical protein